MYRSHQSIAFLSFLFGKESRESQKAFLSLGKEISTFYFHFRKESESVTPILDPRKRTSIFSNSDSRFGFPDPDLLSSTFIIFAYFL